MENKTLIEQITSKMQEADEETCLRLLQILNNSDAVPSSTDSTGIKYSIIIPHHKEDDEKASFLLTSLNISRDINWDEFEIIITNDSKETPNLNTTRYKKIHSHITQIESCMANNPGMSRQTGVNASQGEYIIYLDCDDMLFSDTSLSEMIKQVNENPDYDIYQYTPVYQNPYDETKLLKLPETNIWLYAKIYKKSFLLDHNITFTPKIEYSEDVYYNMIAYNSRARVFRNDLICYIQINNKESVTRKGDEYLQSRALLDLTDCMREATYFLRDNGEMIMQNVKMFAASVLFLVYVKYNEAYTGKFDDPKYSDCIKSANNAIKKYIQEFDPDLTYSKLAFNQNPDMIHNIEEKNMIEKAAYQEDYIEFLERLKNI